MPFNISRFKSTVDKYGGPAKSSLFEVILSKPATPNSRINNEDLTFFCTRVNFPGIAIENQTFTAVAQRPIQFPSTISNNPISALFMVDSDHEVLKFFHNWMQQVLNYSTKDGNFAAIGETPGDLQLPYELGYKDDYACDMIIRHHSIASTGGKYYEVTLHKIYPFVLGDLELAWDDNDSFSVVPVQFAYDKIWYSGDRTGRQTERNGRGLLETLGDLAGFADTVRQTINQGRPQSIQDAVNRLNRVRNSYDRLTDFFDDTGA